MLLTLTTTHGPATDLGYPRNPSLGPQLVWKGKDAPDDQEAKVCAANTRWIRALNNHSEFGRWDFLEIRDPWDAKNEIRTDLNPKSL
jgi:hypothetical protein